MKGRNTIVALCLITLSLLAGCALTPPQYPEIIWPLPPEEPRIKYLGFYKSRHQFPKTGNEIFKEILFGEEIRVTSLMKPYGVATDSKGRLYVADSGHKAVIFIDPEERRFDKIYFGPQIDLVLPLGIVLDGEDNLYVSDVVQNKVFAFDKSMKMRFILGKGGEFSNPTGLAIDNKRQRLYVADSKKHLVRVFDLKGKLLMDIGIPGVGDGELYGPSNVAVDSEGHLYVVDTWNARVQVFDANGKFLRTFGKLGDALGEFVRPKGIAVDSEGHIYVVDAAFNNFQIFSKEGQLLLFVGAAGTDHGRFSLPAGIWIDQDDKIYVTNQMEFARVQVFQYLGDKYKARAKVK